MKKSAPMHPLNPAIAAQVAVAVVRMSRLGGQGVIVPGGFVVTAAHCIGWTATGAMALGDYYTEDIEAVDGRRFRVQPLAVEPVNDLSVLGSLDGQASSEFAEAADAFEAFCGSIAPVDLALEEFEVDVPQAAYVFTHNKGVIGVTVRQHGLDGPNLWFKSAERIDGGTSGGPVVTSAGKLLGIISTSGAAEDDTECTGSVHRVHFAAPLWLVRQMVPLTTRRKLDAALPPGRLPAGLARRIRPR